jgi:signal transduction histidine kinase/CheY-like chemotaxis protein
MEYKNKAFAQFTFSIIKPVAISFTFLYLLFAVAQYYILSIDYKNLMVIMALSTSFYFGIVSLLLYKKTNLFKYHILLSFSLILVPSINTFVHLWIFKDSLQTSLLLLIVIFSGFIFYSKQLFYATISITILFLVFVAYHFNFDSYWVYFLFTIVPAIVLAIAANITLNNNFKKIEEANYQVTVKNTELKKANEILVNQSNQLKQNIIIQEQARHEADLANNYKTEFLANMSHEIRTPLNGVIGFSDLLIQTELNANQKEYIKIINSSAKSLLEVVNNILDFSKIEAGKIEIENEIVNLKELETQVIDIVKFQIEQKKLKLEISNSADIPNFILSDSLRLKQILVNLLGNAIKFTNKGKIEFKIETINIFENNKQTLRFSIIDTGIGIEFKNQKKIFEAFTQEDSTTTRKFGGSGLGLPISNKILNLMNSNLQLESIYGKGSTFYFDVIFDVLKIKPTEVKEESLLNLNSLFIKAPLILVVDDNSINIFLTKILIKNIIPDAKIIEAENGFIALDLFSGNNFNLIIMDILMPVINGYDTTKKIRLQETNNRVPIIGLTAGVMKQEREKCLEAGMDEYLSKPIDKEVLEKTLLKFLTK